jgi:hypothetical protein
VIRFLRRRVAVAAALAAVAVLGGACGGSSTYSSGGVSFDYPKDWQTVLAPASTPGAAGSTARVGVGLDPANLVVLLTTHLAQATDAGSVQQTEQAVVRALSGSARQKGARVQGPSPDRLGSFDGVGLTIAGLPLGGGTVVDSRVIVVVRGGVEYLLNCQSTADHAEDIGAGCRQIIDSFSVS